MEGNTIASEADIKPEDLYAQTRPGRRRAARGKTREDYRTAKPNARMVFDNLDQNRIAKGGEVSLRRELIWSSIEGEAGAKSAKKQARRERNRKARNARRNRK